MHGVNNASVYAEGLSMLAMRAKIRQHPVRKILRIEKTKKRGVISLPIHDPQGFEISNTAEV